MTKRMLIDALHPEEVRVVVADNKRVLDFDFITSAKKQVKGNIYLAKVTRVEPSLQAAFVEYGAGKQGFLPFSEIHADYYQIPIADRKRLLEEEMQANDEDDDEDDDISPTTHASDADEEPAALDGEVTETAMAFPELPQLPEAIETAEEDAEAPVDAAPLAAELPEALVEEAPEAKERDADEPMEAKSEDEGEETDGESKESQGVETLDGEDEIQPRRKKRHFSKRYKIQEVIRRGQVVLVQVIKEERGNKGASLTTYLSLAGRYCVLMPNSPKDGGISRKIAGGEDRKRLKAISAELRLTQGMSVIIRTAGMERTRTEIKRDFDYLVKLWNQIRDVTLQSNAPALIYEESDIIKRAIRDQFSNDMDEVVVQGDEAFESARDFMKLLLPSQTPKIKSYNDATPLFYAYDVEDQLLSMHDPVVKLKSGGYLVINPTEALISVDVNSGRATGERNIEETATKTNLEAANELARQLKLRDLAGLIVIDFIDMMESRNRRQVERAMKDALKADRAKIQIGRISPFGLMEMSRQRIRPSITESNMVPCEHCSGRGVVRSQESMSIQILRALEKEGSTGTWSSLRLIASQSIALHLLNTKRAVLQDIEVRHSITIQILIDAEMGTSDYNLEKMRRSQSERQKYERTQRNKVQVEAPQEPSNDNAQSASGEEDQQESTGRKRSRRRRGGRGRGRRNDRQDQTNEMEAGNELEAQDGFETDDRADNTSDADQNDEVETIEAADGDDNAPKRRGRGRRGSRGSRGRKRWRDQDEDGNESSEPKSDREERSAQSGDETADEASDRPSSRRRSPRNKESDTDSADEAPSAKVESVRPAPRVNGANGFLPDSAADRPAAISSTTPISARSTKENESNTSDDASDGKKLPSFATQEQPVISIAEKRPAPEPMVASPMVENAASASGNPRKGWWQKMIELDD